MILKNFGVLVASGALVAVGLVTALPAMAATPSYDSWIESGDPAPFDTTGGLVFYKAANINFGHLEGTAPQPLVPLAELDGLAYTVAQSTSYAPSYQIGIVNVETKVTYARLVWEPYMQSPAAGEKTGAYTDLEQGLWWGANVWQAGTKTTPFGTGDGSQSKPQPLSFFVNHFGPGTQVAFFGSKQGTTTDSISTVTSLTFEGANVALGTADETPFTSKDVDTAVAKATDPLTTKVADLTKQLDVYKASHPLTPAEAREGYVNTAAAAKAKWGLVEQGSLGAPQNDAATAKAKLVSISGTKKVGMTVTAKTEAIFGAARTYQWYVAAKPVRGATTATFKLPKSSAGHSLYVIISTSWTDATGVKHKVVATARNLRTAYIAR